MEPGLRPASDAFVQGLIISGIVAVLASIMVIILIAILRRGGRY